MADVLGVVNNAKGEEILNDPTVDLAECFITISEAHGDLIEKLNPYLKQYSVKDIKELRRVIEENDNEEMPNSYEIKLLLAKIDELKKAMATLSGRMNRSGAVREGIYEQQ